MNWLYNGDKNKKRTCEIMKDNERTLTTKVFWKKNPISPFSGWIRKQIEITSWALKGYPIPSPDKVKVNTVKKYADMFGIKTFVETGTYLGQMIDGIKEIFDTIISIELDDFLFKRAADRFARFENITILHGDSASLLPGCIESIKTPILFWLDAHYSAGITAKADKETPIWLEVESILKHPLYREHVILIDDARCFDGTNDYPTLQDLERLVKSVNPDFVVAMEDDIVRIHRKI
jgi:hypothetical protein